MISPLHLSSLILLLVIIIILIIWIFLSRYKSRIVSKGFRSQMNPCTVILEEGLQMNPCPITLEEGSQVNPCAITLEEGSQVNSSPITLEEGSQVNPCPITLEEGLSYVDVKVAKLKDILEEKIDEGFRLEERARLYSAVHDLCTRNSDNFPYCQIFYDKFKSIMEDYLRFEVLPALREKSDEFMLKDLVKRWSNHKIMVKWLIRFFHYLSRYFLVRGGLPALEVTGIVCFRDLIYNELNVQVVDTVISLINQERDGAQIDRSLLMNVVDIFVGIGMGDMSFYENDFEAAMLANTAVYYSRKASNWITEDSCPDYMVKSEECLKGEKDRVAHYLHSSTEEKLLKSVQHELLSMYATQLLEKEHSGCRALLRNDSVKDLSRMYRLFSKIPGGLEPIGKMFKEHVTDEGIALVKQTEEDAKNKKKDSGVEQVFVRKLIELYDKYMTYVTDACFMNDSVFHKAFKESFEVFCNKDVGENSSAEILAIFCDNLLKKAGGGEKLSEEAIEETLDKVVKLISYISDKDLFSEFSRKKLARRLLFDRSANEEYEKSFLTKLKQQWGTQFTSKMQGMVTDLTLSRDSQAGMEDYLGQLNNPQIVSLNVTVLTTGYWPTYKFSDIHLPAELVRCVELYQTFYESKFRKRKLSWVYSLGTCNINGKFDKRSMEMIVTTYQAAALVLFNDSNKLSYDEIKTQLNLSDDDIMRILHSLSCARYKILNKEPSTKEISCKDVFVFNPSFTDKMRRIRVPLPPLDEKKKVIEDVDKDRRYLIDASIVRIMKSRKAMGYQELVLECIDQLGKNTVMFKPDVRTIKKRIEELITRDYLERDKENPNIFKYIA